MVSGSGCGCVDEISYIAPTAAAVKKGKEDDDSEGNPVVMEA
jgi:hypothetical protein